MLFRKDPGKELRKLMAEHNVNTNELADATRLARTTISRLRTGQVQKPNIKTARRVCRYFGVQPNDIWPGIGY